MADASYGTTFSVYLNSDFRPVCLISRTCMSVLDRLEQEGSTVSDLARSAGLPKSTVQSALARICRLRLARVERSIEDRRKVLYFPSSLFLLRNADASDLSHPLLQCPDAPPTAGCFWDDLLRDVGAYMFRRGADIAPLMGSVGSLMGARYRADRGWVDPGTLESALRRLVCPESRVTVDFDGTSVTIDCAPENGFGGRAAFLMALGFLEAYLPRGIRMEVVMDCDGRMSATAEGGRAGVVPTGTGNDEAAEGGRFRVFQTSEGTVLIGGDGMIDVADLLEGRSLSVADVSATLDILNITAYTTVSKLRELGIVRVSSGPEALITTFTLVSGRILSVDPSHGGPCPDPLDYDIEGRSCPAALALSLLAGSMRIRGTADESVFFEMGRRSASGGRWTEGGDIGAEGPCCPASWRISPPGPVPRTGTECSLPFAPYSNTAIPIPYWQSVTNCRRDPWTSRRGWRYCRATLSLDCAPTGSTGRRSGCCWTRATSGAASRRNSGPR